MIVYNMVIGAILGAFIGRILSDLIEYLPSILLSDNQDEFEMRLFWKKRLKIQRCIHCKQRSLLEKLPIIRYFYQMEPCQKCQRKASIQSLIIELITTVLFASILSLFPVSIITLFVLINCCLLMCCFFTDFNEKLLPDQFTLALIWTGLVGSLFPIFVSSHDSIIGAVVGYSFFRVFNEMYYLFRGFDGMFPGDFKLIAGIGACMGLNWLIVIIFSSLVLVIMTAISQLFLRKDHLIKNFLYREMPFGCYLSTIAIIALMIQLIETSNV